MCILSVCKLLKVVSHYDFSVLSTSVMGFPKKMDRGVDGWGELYPVFSLGFFDFFLTLQSTYVAKRPHKPL